jgi:hypothetical protein
MSPAATLQAPKNPNTSFDAWLYHVTTLRRTRAGSHSRRLTSRGLTVTETEAERAEKLILYELAVGGADQSGAPRQDG